MCEITLDDGAVTTTYVRLLGVHESGRTLPEIEIPAADLANFNWMAERWGMDCILEVRKTVKDCVRHAIQTTAAHAEKKTVFAVTGWKKIGEEFFLRFLHEQGECFTIKPKGLLKALAEEDLIKTSAGQNTVSIRINGKSRRVMCLDKHRAKGSRKRSPLPRSSPPLSTFWNATQF